MNFIISNAALQPGPPLWNINYRVATIDYFHYRWICWLFSRLTVWCLKCNKMMKHANHTLLKPKVPSSNYIFCPMSSPKPRDIQFTVICDKKKLQILILKKLESENDVLSHSCRSIVCQSTDRLIDWLFQLQYEFSQTNSFSFFKIIKQTTLILNKQTGKRLQKRPSQVSIKVCKWNKAIQQYQSTKF